MCRKFIVKFTIIGALCTVLAACPGGVFNAAGQMNNNVADDLVVQCQKIVDAALQPTKNWPLPPPGPPGLPGKNIAFIGENFRNAGVLGVGEGVREGADCINWDVKFFDMGGNPGLSHVKKMLCRIELYK